jgi:hypothetical protein
MIYAIKYVKEFATDEYIKFTTYVDTIPYISADSDAFLRNRGISLHNTLIDRAYTTRFGLLSTCTIPSIKTLIVLDNITYEDIVITALKTKIGVWDFPIVCDELLTDNITDIELFESYTKILSTHPSNKEYLQYIFAKSYLKYCKTGNIKFEDPQEVNSIREAIKIFELDKIPAMKVFGLVQIVDKQQFSNAEEVINFIVSILIADTADLEDFKECIPFIFSTSTMLMITDNDIEVLASKIVDEEYFLYRARLLRNMKIAKVTAFDQHMSRQMKLMDIKLETV